jgi:hypothetical protein
VNQLTQNKTQEKRVSDSKKQHTLFISKRL